MRQNSIYSKLHIKLFLVITAILIFMFMGLHLVDAQEPDDTPLGAIPISPNGPSQVHTFSLPMDRDWFTFFAEQGVTYQIFTRPKNPGYPHDLLDTVIDLFFDPAKRQIARNDDFKNDGSSLIEWLCPTTGVYFVRVQAYDSGRFGLTEAYSIQITSIDRQEAQTFIPDVPDYSQSDFGDPGNCGPVAAACVLGYWDSHGYDLLVDSDPDRIEDVAKLVHELQEAMQYPSNKTLGGVKDENICDGIEFVCNITKYGNNYNFEANYIYSYNFFDVVDEILNKRPVLYGVIGHSIWKEHWMVTVGYLETNTTLWTINHDTWSTTHRDIYVDWDEATDCIITIRPVDPPPPPPPPPQPVIHIPGFNNQFFPSPFVIPGMGIFPPLGLTVFPFSGIAAMPVTMWSSPLSTGYSTQSNWGGSRGTNWLGSSEVSYDSRIMAGNIYSGPFSTYGYNFNDSGLKNYSSGYKNTIIPNPTQGSYLGSGLSYYPSMDVPSQNPIVFSNNPFFSTSQMLIPASGLLPYPIFSPFYSLSAGPFLYGFPF